MGKERQWRGRWSITKGEKGGMAANMGCMSGMLHYFDFHHLLFTGTGHNTPRSAPNTSYKTRSTNGLEAPRNSLEKEDAKVSSSSAIEDEFFDIPVGIQLAPTFDSIPIKIKKKHTSKLSISEDDDEKRIPQTPETPRTPSLVARLMGIDGLPDPAPSPPVSARQRPLLRASKESSMRDQCKKNDKENNQKDYKREPRQPLRSINCNIRNRDLGSRSLPDSPRVSSSRSLDVEHRLSLQINRENSNSINYHPSVGGDYSLPPSPTHYTMKPRRRYHDENRSPRRQEYAKEIVKKVKESVSNRIRNECDDKYIPRTKTNTTTGEVQNNSVICENIEKVVQIKPVQGNILGKISELPSKAKLADEIPNLQTLVKPPRVKPSRPPPPPPAQEGQTGKCNKASNERFTARFKKPNPPPCSPLGATNGEKQHFTVAMEKSESAPKLLRSPQFKNDECTSSSMQMKVGTTRPPPNQDPEYKYVRSILHRGGFMSNPTSKPVPFFSTSVPVDPIIFHQLELELPVEDWRYRSNPLRYRWNRKLLFHLVQEFLEDIMQDYPSTMSHNIFHGKCRAVGRKNWDSGLQLFKKLWTEIQNIRSLDCQYLGDLDALVAADLATKNMRELTRHPAVGDEADDMAEQMEQEILDELIGETAASLLESAQFPRRRVT